MGKRHAGAGHIVLILGHKHEAEPAIGAGFELAQRNLRIPGKRPLADHIIPLLYQLTGLGFFCALV